MRRFLSNISFLAIERLLQVAIAATVGVLIARSLGPSEFGRMNYVVAFVGLFVVVVPLGLPSVLVREIVRDKSAQERLLSVAFGLQGAAAVLTYVIALLAVFASAPNDQTMLSLAAIYGLTLLAKPADVYRSWFEAEVRIGPVVRMNMIVLVLASIGKVAAVLAGAPLWVFLAIQTAAMIGNSLVFALVYARVAGTRPRPVWDRPTADALLGQSWPLIISAVGLVLYLKIDQVMLGYIAGNEEIGIYSAALRLSEIWYAVPVMLMSTFFPAIVHAHENDAAQFDARVSALLDIFNGMSIGIALIISLSSGWLVSFLYGPAYAGAGPVLALHVWAAVFIFMGTMTGKWYLLAGIQKLNIFRNFLGAGINIGLNLWMIPLWGAWGAALATLISYSAANYFADVLTTSARPLFFLKTLSLLLWPRILWRPKERLMQLRTTKAPK